MGKYNYGEPMMNCPYCNAICRADWVDVGFSTYDVQCGPFHCEQCGAFQIGPYDNIDYSKLSEIEKKVNWYKPGTDPTISSGNVIDKKFVSYKQMEQTYKDHFTDNILWNDDKYVKEWWENIRNNGAKRQGGSA